MKPITENSIVRVGVAAIVVIETSMGSDNFIDTRCVSGDPNGGIYKDANKRVVGTVPAPAGTFEVYGKDHDGELHWLGTEFKGATNPDWVEEFKHTLDVIDRRRE